MDARTLARWAKEEGWSGGLFEDNVKSLLWTVDVEKVQYKFFLRHLYQFIRQQQESSND